MVELVAELLRRASADERGPVVYLLQAQLRPPFERVEVGLCEKLLIKANSAAYDASGASVTKRLHRAGDPGLVAEALAPPIPWSATTVRQAHDALLAARPRELAGPAVCVFPSEALTRAERDSIGETATMCAFRPNLANGSGVQFSALTRRCMTGTLAGRVPKWSEFPWRPENTC
jgi:hypothetical protein